MNKFMKKMLKSGTVTGSVLSESRFFHVDDFIDTGFPLINLALSGSLDKGFTNGITMFAGPSKHFKSNYLCICMAAYQKAKPDGVILFYDTEFGTKKGYFESFGVDPDRVIHIPINNIEELTFDIMGRFKDIDVDDEVMIAVDSFGNVPSKREMDNAESENSAQDMTRAKTLKSFGRMVTPQLALKRIPLIGVNHVYQTQETYSKQVMSGGTGLEYSSDTIVFVGRRQLKEGSELLGYDFVLRIAKSRFVKESSEFPILVTYDGGVERLSGIFDLAVKQGIIKQSGAWYEKAGGDKKYRRKELEQDLEFMNSILSDSEFRDKVHTKYALPVAAPPNVDFLEEEENDEFLEEIS